MAKQAPLNVPVPTGKLQGPWYDYFMQSSPHYDLLSISTLKADASKIITLNKSEIYSKYVIELIDIIRSNSSSLLLRTSANYGVTIASSSGDYRWALEYPRGSDAAAQTANSSSTGTSIKLSGTDSTNLISGKIEVYSMTDAGTKTMFNYTTLCHQTYPERVRGAGTRDSASVVNAVQILPSSNTLTSGTILLYGLKRAQ